MPGKLTVQAMGRPPVVVLNAGPGASAYSVPDLERGYPWRWVWSVWTANLNRQFDTLEDAAEWLDTLPPHQ